MLTLFTWTKCKCRYGIKAKCDRFPSIICNRSRIFKLSPSASSSAFNYFKNETFAELVKITVFLAAGERKQSSLLNGWCSFQKCHLLTKRKKKIPVGNFWVLSKCFPGYINLLFLFFCFFFLAWNTNLYLICTLQRTLTAAANSGLVQTHIRPTVEPKRVCVCERLE